MLFLQNNNHKLYSMVEAKVILCRAGAFAKLGREDLELFPVLGYGSAGDLDPFVFQDPGDLLIAKGLVRRFASNDLRYDFFHAG